MGSTPSAGKSLSPLSPFLPSSPLPSLHPHPQSTNSHPSILESTLRTCNNLLERLHASFFFYLFVGPGTFMKIGSYLPSAILVGTAMLFTGLGEWVGAGWTFLPSEPQSPGGAKNEKAAPSGSATVGKWRRRVRPVLEPIVIMVLTHLLGVLLFFLVKGSWFAANQKVRPTSP